MADYVRKITLDLEAQGLSKIAKQVQEVGKNAFSTSSMRAYADQAKKVSESFNKNIASAVEMGMKRTASTLSRSFAEADKNISRAMSDIQSAQEALINATGKEAHALEKTIQKKQKLIETELKSLDKATKSHESILNTRREALENSGVDGAAKMADALGDEITDVFNNFKAGDLRGFGKALGGALQKGGTQLQAAGGAAPGAGGAAMSGLGKTAAALGKAATTLAAVAGPLAAIVGILVAVDNQTKELNRSLLEGAGAADMFSTAGARGLLEFRGTMKSARDAAIGLSFEYRTSASEILGILAAANEAGLAFNRMEKAVGGASSELEAYTKFAETALINSRLLGVSTKEISELSAQWLRDFGGSLQTVQQGFDSIFAAAQVSGISVKRFYGMVSQATAGLTLYNHNIEESAALIANLSKSLGDQGAADFVASLQKGFTDESYQDRFKRILLTGQDTTADVIEKNAANLGKRFAAGINSAAPEIQDGVRKAFSDSKLDFDALARGDANALKALSGMSAQEQRRLISQVGQTDDAAAKQLQTLVGLTQGMTGKLGDQAKALDELGPGGTLAMKLGQSEKFFGKGVSELSGNQLAAFEQFSGISGEQLHQLQRLDERMRGDYELAKEQGEEVGSFKDYLMDNAATIEKAMIPPLSAQEAMAKEMVRNTQSLSSIMENTIVYLLEQMTGLLQTLVDFTRGQNPHAAAMRDSVLESNKKQQEAIRANMDMTEQELSDLNIQMKQATGTERERLERQVQMKEEEARAQKDALETLKSEEAATRKVDVSGPLTAMYREAVSGGQANTVMGAALPAAMLDSWTLPGLAMGVAGGSLSETLGMGAVSGITGMMGVQHGQGARESRLREGLGASMTDIELATMSPEQRQKMAEEAAARRQAEQAFATQEELLEEQVEQGDVSVDTLQKMQQLEEAGQKDVGGQLKDVTGELDKANRRRKMDMVKALMEVKAMELGGAMGLAGDDLQSFAEGLTRGDEGAQRMLRQGFAGGQLTGDDTRTAAQFGVQMRAMPNDFIYHTGSNAVTPISNKDTLVGAMEGGPISQAMGGGGGPMTVNVNVNGGNQREVYNTVKQAIAAGRRDRVGRGAR